MFQSKIPFFFWQGISKSGLSSSRSLGKVASKKYKNFPIGYRPVRVDWKDLDKCSVCHMDEVRAGFRPIFIYFLCLYNHSHSRNFIFYYPQLTTVLLK